MPKSQDRGRSPLRRLHIAQRLRWRVRNVTIRWIDRFFLDHSESKGLSSAWVCTGFGGLSCAWRIKDVVGALALLIDARFGEYRGDGKTRGSRRRKTTPRTILRDQHIRRK